MAVVADSGVGGSMFVGGEREERGEFVQTLIPYQGDELPVNTGEPSE
ncbi:MAG: hypothetical protein JW940_08995 [Polyangiaceae bacterium]|nr:hypothetical protein [Polyangiaceae bacterium]